MSIKVLNHPAPMIDAMASNIQGERIKRLKSQHFQSFGKTLHAPLDHNNNDIRAHHNDNDNHNHNMINHNMINPHQSSHYNVQVMSLLNNKKLFLVLDLDHTLLNSIRLENLTSEEEYLKNRASQDISKGSLYMLDKLGIMTKLRPFVHKFLQEANNMFEMCIYTMGNRTYALEMAKILDPENKYFKSRIISQEDCPKRDYKGLDVLQVPENMVLVLDDTEVVWQKHKDNLIVMDRYFYFSSGCREFGYNGKSLSLLKRDEDEFDGALSTIIRVLRRVHHDFFDNSNPQFAALRDVRQVLKIAKRDVLKDCKILFSAVFPRNSVASNHRLWKMAEDLGATCTTELDSCVTHVVSTNCGTEKSQWAVREHKFLVHPRWIEAAFYLWRRQLEHKFPVKLAKPTTRMKTSD